MAKHTDSVSALVDDIRLKLRAANKSEIKRKTNISLSTLKRIANVDGYVPRVGQLIKLADYFGAARD